MQINDLKRKNPNKKTQRLGRGGLRGKTSGRGHKGQRQHGDHGVRSELRDQIKKIPKLRGRGKNSNTPTSLDNVVVNLATLETFYKAGETVTPASLKEKGIIKGGLARKSDVKILGNGELTKKLTIEGCLVSEKARTKISEAGGSVA